MKLDKENKISIFIIVSIRHWTVSPDSVKDPMKMFWLINQTHLKGNEQLVYPCTWALICSTHTKQVKEKTENKSVQL